MNFIKKIPVPTAALILALAALGNLIQSYGNNFRLIFGAIAGLLFLLVLVKFLAFPKLVGGELKNPVAASVLPAFSMATMLLATYIKPVNNTFASIIWYIGVLLHIIFIIDFSIKYLLHFDLKKVFPSWFIVYVGIAVASVTGPAFDRSNVGKVAFWFAFISYFFILFINIKRFKEYRDIPEAAQPTFAIFAAPASLCLAGYINSFENKSFTMIYFLLVLSQLTYLIILTQVPRLLKSKFYPSFASLTFPMVITALSLKLTNGFITDNIGPVALLKYLLKFEELVALVIVIYVLGKYILFLTEKEG